MRTVLIGVVYIARECFRAILESGADIMAIFIANKGKMIKRSGMYPNYFTKSKDLAVKHNIVLNKIIDMSIALATKRISQLLPDSLCCIVWTQILKRDILQLALL
ncbi:hypothetical protein ACFLU4_04395 [Chloroflexota bacterium]